jgi:cytochrome oxidase Cu insertion factor (SCO1/SenC/PrrC family)
MAMTRRKWLTTMGSGTLAAGVGAIAARGFGALGGGTAHHFQPVPATGAGSPRAVLQQKHLLNLPLMTQDGKSVKFYDDLVKDKKVVLTFMNTEPGALASSKTVSENLSELQKFFGSRMGKDIHFYTITANPQRDTPAVLKNWASQYSNGSGWTFLTGSAANVDKLRRSLGFADEFGMARPTRTSRSACSATAPSRRCAGRTASRWRPRESSRTRCCWTSGPTPRISAHRRSGIARSSSPGCPSGGCDANAPRK